MANLQSPHNSFHLSHYNDEFPIFMLDIVYDGGSRFSAVLREKDWWYAAIACLYPVYIYRDGTACCTWTLFINWGPLFRFCVNKIGGTCSIVHSLRGSFVCWTFYSLKTELIFLYFVSHFGVILCSWMSILPKDFNEVRCCCCSCSYHDVIDIHKLCRQTRLTIYRRLFTIPYGFNAFLHSTNRIKRNV